MNDTQIKTFLTVAKCMNFTEASYQLYTVQSAVSRTISGMEQELGYPLFARFHQDTRLTSAGLVLYEGLKKLYGQYQDLQREAERAYMQVTGTLAIGFLEGQLLDPATQEILLVMEQNYPDVRTHIVRSSFGQLNQQLLNNQLDVIFTMDFAEEGVDGVKYVPVQSFPHYLMIPKQNPLIRKTNLTLYDLRDETFIGIKPYDTPNLTPLLKASCRQAGFEAKVVEVDTLSEALLWVETGRGVSAFNEYYSACYSPLLEQRAFPEFPDRKLVLAWNPKNLNPLIPVIAKLASGK